MEIEKTIIYLDEILDALDGTDGIFSSVTIFDERIRKILEDMDVIKTNVKGSSYSSDNYKNFRDFIITLVYD